MRVIYNKEDMISYYKLKGMRKKGNAKILGQNLGQNLSKLAKIGKKNWYYVHFQTKNT